MLHIQMGNSHTPQGGGHGQMNPGGMVAVGEGGCQTHSQRQMCVRNGCSNHASNPTEYDIFYLCHTT